MNYLFRNAELPRMETYGQEGTDSEKKGRASY